LHNSVGSLDLSTLWLLDDQRVGRKEPDLAMNGGHCPLTDLASRNTTDRTDNFDIYLPLWLARRNKTIFGTLYALGELFVLGRWLIS
jgi:hypothetical protein